MQGNVVAEDRRGRHRRGTIQLSHGIAAGRPGPARRRRHELPRAGSGSLRKVRIRRRADGGRFGVYVPAQGNRQGFRGAPLRCRRAERVGAGLRPRKDSCSITSGRRARGSGNFSCPPVCLSIATTACLWSIPTIVAFRCFSTSRWESNDAPAKTTMTGRWANGQIGQWVFPYLPTCPLAYLPSLCLGILMLALLGFAGAARAHCQAPGRRPM